MGPIDYTSAFARIPSPAQAFTDSFRGFADVQQQGMKMDQQALALQVAQQQRETLARLASNPNATADDFASAMTQIPSLAEHLHGHPQAGEGDGRVPDQAASRARSMHAGSTHVLTPCAITARTPSAPSSASPQIRKKTLTKTNPCSTKGGFR